MQRTVRRPDQNDAAYSISPLLYLGTIYVILHTFGFPGQYAVVFGGMIETLVKYSTFLVQIAILVMTSGNSIMEIRILNIRLKYWPVYLLLGGIFLISLIGSNDKKTIISYCISLSVNVIFMLWVCDNYTAEKMLEMVYHSQIIFTILSIIFEILFSRYKDSFRTGVYMGCLHPKNTVAAQLAFGFLMQSLLLLVKMHHKRPITKPFMAFLVLQLVLLRLSQGTGAMFTALIPVFYLAFMYGKFSLFKKRLWLGYIYIVANIGFLIFALTVIQWVAPFIESLGKDATLSGRTITWNKLIAVMQEEKTMTGYGYCHFWEDSRALLLFHRGFTYKESWFKEMSFGAHNNILELWCNIGLMGVGLLFFTFIAAFRKPSRWTYDQYIFIAGFMINFTIFGMTETSFTTYGFMTVFMFLAMAYACKGNDQEGTLFN